MDGPLPEDRPVSAQRDDAPGRDVRHDEVEFPVPVEVADGGGCRDDVARRHLPSDRTGGRVVHVDDPGLRVDDDVRPSVPVEVREGRGMANVVLELWGLPDHGAVHAPERVHGVVHAPRKEIEATVPVDVRERGRGEETFTAEEGGRERPQRASVRAEDAVAEVARLVRVGRLGHYEVELTVAVDIRDGGGD